MNTLKSKKKIVSAALAVSMLGTSIAAFAYTDVPEDSWYAPYVEFMSENSYMKGYTDGTFRPDQYITRAEVAQVMVNAVEGLSNAAMEESSQTMSDVDGSAWYATAMKKAAGAGIFTGDAGTVAFRPNDYITRQEAAVVVFRALKLDTVDNAAVSFGDAADIADWAYNYVATMVVDGIIGGDQNGNFLPLNNITRAEISKIVTLAHDAANIEDLTVNVGNGTGTLPGGTGGVTTVVATARPSSGGGGGGGGSASRPTVGPTATAAPTATADPSATATPVPTATAKPVATVKPEEKDTEADKVLDTVGKTEEEVKEEVANTVTSVSDTSTTKITEKIDALPDDATEEQVAEAIAEAKKEAAVESAVEFTNGQIAAAVAAYNKAVAASNKTAENEYVSSDVVESLSKSAASAPEKESVYAPLYAYLLAECNDMFSEAEADSVAVTAAIIEIVNLTGDEIITSVKANGSCEGARADLVSFVKNDVMDILTARFGAELAQGAESQIRLFALDMFSDPTSQTVIDNTAAKGGLIPVTLRWTYKFAGKAVDSSDAYYTSDTATKNYYVIPEETPAE